MSNPKNSYKPNEGQKRFGTRTILPPPPEYQVTRPEKARSKESEARRAKLQQIARDGINRRYVMRPIRAEDQRNHPLYEEDEAA